MKVTMVIPCYWGRKKRERAKPTDAVYDHPTPLDEEGTLGRILESLSILENKDFTLVVLGVATAGDIRPAVERRLSALIKEAAPVVETKLFSYTQLNKVHTLLEKGGQSHLCRLLKLDGYSNVRNLCLFVTHLLDSEIAVLIDDDEVFEDPQFMHKAMEFIGSEKDGEKILAVAGYYINPDNDFYLNKDITPWMTYWNKVDCMNRAFRAVISQGPRLKVTPFAFGGNMVIHRDLFMMVPFDPSVPRGEDIDFLINARIFGYNVYLDNELAIKHLAPPKTFPLWRRMREDILRFVFEKNKLDSQEDIPGMKRVAAEDLDPYPGEFLKPDLEEKIFRSNQMIATDYLAQGDTEGARECMNNIFLARTHLTSGPNLFRHLLQLQEDWKGLMDFFTGVKVEF